jgi:hypothetical protein
MIWLLTPPSSPVSTVRPFRKKKFPFISEMKRNLIRLANVSLVHLKNSVIFFRFFLLLFFYFFASLQQSYFQFEAKRRENLFIASKETRTVHFRFKNILFRFKKHFFRNTLLHIFLYIINFAGRISKAAMGGWEARAGTCF